MFEHLISQLSAVGIVPVVKLDRPGQAVPLARALAEGGVPCAEITFRTDAAAEAIARVKEAMPSMLLGAGTVLTTAQADAAKAAGAAFAVSPGFNPRVVDHCLAIGLPVFPGCATPSDMEQALERGLTLVKFFPAEQAGGLAYLKAVAAPYAALRFMPTGGVGPDNLGKYLSFPKIAACGGSWMVKPAFVEAENYAEITRLCREAAEIAASARVKS